MEKKEQMTEARKPEPPKKLHRIKDALEQHERALQNIRARLLDHLNNFEAHPIPMDGEPDCDAPQNFFEGMTQTVGETGEVIGDIERLVSELEQIV